MSEAAGRYLACPECGADTEVKDSRPRVDERGIRRRRECQFGHRFQTVEVIVPKAGVVVRPGVGGSQPEITAVADFAANVTKAAGDAVRRWLVD